MRLLNKDILITGASQGIGKATALLCAKNGANVYAVDINKTGLDSLRNDHPSIKTYVTNVTNKKELEHLSQEIGYVEILFNCVGFVHNGTILECNQEDWDTSLNINITSMYLITKLFLPLMVKNRKGNIINMSSVASSIKGVKNRFVYGVTKAAVIGFTKSISADFIQYNVRCNAICPGTISSPSLEGRIKSSHNSYEKGMKEFIKRQPIGRIGSSLEVANLSLYLASDESSYTTGSINIIDGGWSN